MLSCFLSNRWHKIMKSVSKAVYRVIFHPKEVTPFPNIVISCDNPNHSLLALILRRSIRPEFQSSLNPYLQLPQIDGRFFLSAQTSPRFPRLD